MTKEELEKEAEEYGIDNFEQCMYDDVKGWETDCKARVQAYIDGAEPREKRIAELIALINAERERQEKCDDVHLRTIAELEKENAELKNKLEHRNCLDCSNHSSKLRLRTLELEKENTELKDYRLTTLAKQQTDMSKYALNLEHKLSWYDDQLTKAKELLKQLVDIEYAINIPKEKIISLRVKAEQFLSEVEK